MEKVMKKGLAALAVLCLVSCTTGPLPAGNADNTQVIMLKASEGTDQKVYIADVGHGQKGASFSIEIQLPVSNSGFKTAAGSNGKAAKTAADIQNYIIYLVKNSDTNSYPLNGDPLGSADLVPNSTFTITNSGAATRTVTFTNVPDSNGNGYYVAVRARDVVGNDLIKPNNGSTTLSWTGTTATANGQVAVSTGKGVVVTPSLAVTNNTNTLSVVPNLADAIGATLQADVFPVNGSGAAIPALKGESILGEFRANTYTFNNQINPSVAMYSSGNFVIAWEGAGPSDGNGIYAQRYNSDGFPQIPSGCSSPNCDPVTGEFKVNTYTTNAQINPSVAMDGNGNFVITWQSNQDGGSGTNGGNGIYAQRYNASGIAQSGEFKVNSTIAGSQTSSSIGMSAPGGFVITWQSDQDGGSGTNGGNGIYAQRYDPFGTAVGGEFLVNTFINGSQTSPSIGIDKGSGNFVITWQSDAQDGSVYGIYAQRYNSTAVQQIPPFCSLPNCDPVTGEFKVNTYTTNAQINPSVAMDGFSNFVITWQSDQDGGSGTNGGNGIYAQRYNASGIAQSGEFKVNSTIAGSQTSSSIGMFAPGNFVITWQSDQDGGSGTNGGNGIYAQRYNVGGIYQGSETKANTTTANSQSNPSAAMDGNGNFFITWQSDAQDGSGYGVYGQRYNSVGTAK
jgi:hypothetical protein